MHIKITGKEHNKQLQNSVISCLMGNSFLFNMYLTFFYLIERLKNLIDLLSIFTKHRDISLNLSGCSSFRYYIPALATE